MDTYDFVRVQSVMGFLNWTWWDAQTSPPSLHEIRKTASYVMTAAIKDMKDNEPFFYVGTGGFLANIYRHDNSEYQLELSFQL